MPTQDSPNRNSHNMYAPPFSAGDSRPTSSYEPLGPIPRGQIADERAEGRNEGRRAEGGSVVERVESRNGDERAEGGNGHERAGGGSSGGGSGDGGGSENSGDHGQRNKTSLTGSAPKHTQCNIGHPKSNWFCRRLAWVSGCIHSHSLLGVHQEE